MWVKEAINAEQEFMSVVEDVSQAVPEAMKSLERSYTNLRACSSIEFKNPIYVEHRERLCLEMISYGTDNYPQTIKHIEKFSEMISEEFLSLETPEQFLNSVERLIAKCQESKAHFEALHEKHTVALSRIDTLEAYIKEAAEKFEKKSINANVSAAKKKRHSDLLQAIGFGAVVLSGGALLGLVAGVTVTTIGANMSHEADTLEKEAVELALTSGQMKALAESVKPLSSVVETIWRFLACMVNHSRHMARTANQTKSLTRAEVNLRKFQDIAQRAIDACDEFLEAKSTNERLLLGIVYHYTEKTKDDKSEKTRKIKNDS